MREPRIPIRRSTIVVIALLVVIACGGLAYGIHVQNERVDALKKPFTPVPVIGQNCGNLSYFGFNSFVGIYQGSAIGPRAFQVAVDCFSTAYSQCSEATISVGLVGVDAGTSYTATVQRKNNTCKLMMTSLATNVIFHTHRLSGPFPCAELVESGTLVVLEGCGSLGDITLITDFSRVVPLADSPDCTPPDWKARISCLLPGHCTHEETIQFDVHSADQTARHTFYRFSENGTCLLQDAVQVVTPPLIQPGVWTAYAPFVIYTCDGVHLTAGGGVVQGCGAEGDIIDGDSS